MPTRIWDRLAHLADGCRVSAVTDIDGIGEGWTVDTWTLGAEDVTKLLAAYRELLVPSYDEQVRELLTARGIDLDALLVDAPGSELVTRADLCELAGAASLLAADGWPGNRLAMPNIPKSSRRRSESGIDIMSTTLLPEEAGELVEGELLLLASVKHTLVSASRLRYDLVASVRDELSPAYVAMQLRVYDERLRSSEPALKTDRLFLYLDEFPHPRHVRIVAVAVTDPELGPEMKAQLCHLPDVPAGIHTVRVMSIPGLACLHERAV